MKTQRFTKDTYRSDKSFPVAFDSKMNRVSAEDALQGDKNEKYYCPKCIRINKYQKTLVVPSDHTPPRFGRSPSGKERHLHECYYKRSGNYLPYVTKKLNIDFHGGTIQLSLMNPDGDGFYRSSFLSRYRTYRQNDHHLFMKLIQEVLTDTFYFDYNRDLKDFLLPKPRYEKKQPNVKDFLTSLEDIQNQSTPAKARANLLIGTILETYWENSSYYSLAFESPAYDCRILISRLFYSYNDIKSLLGQRLAVFGYVEEFANADGSFYYVEVFSLPHQLAILDGHYPDAPRPRELQEELYLRVTNLLINNEFVPLDPSEFHALYSDTQTQLRESLSIKIQALERKHQNSESTISELFSNKERLNEQLLPLYLERTRTQEKLSSWWTRLIKGKQLQMKLDQLCQKIWRLEGQLNELQPEIDKLQKANSDNSYLMEETRLRLEQLERDHRQESERKSPMKGKLFIHGGHVLSLTIDSDGNVSIQIVPIQRKDSFYIPTQKPNFHTTSLNQFKYFTDFLEKIENLCIQYVNN